jgi:hypothetical protein
MGPVHRLGEASVVLSRRLATVVSSGSTIPAFRCWMWTRRKPGDPTSLLLICIQNKASWLKSILSLTGA